MDKEKYPKETTTRCRLFPAALAFIGVCQKALPCSSGKVLHYCQPLRVNPDKCSNARPTDTVKLPSYLQFDDTNLIFDAIQNAEKMLTFIGVEYFTVFLPDYIAAIGLRRMANLVQRELSPYALNRDEYLAKVRREKVDAIIYMRQNPLAAVAVGN